MSSFKILPKEIIIYINSIDNKTELYNKLNLLLQDNINLKLLKNLKQSSDIIENIDDLLYNVINIKYIDGDIYYSKLFLNNYSKYSKLYRLRYLCKYVCKIKYYITKNNLYYSKEFFDKIDDYVIFNKNIELFNKLKDEHMIYNVCNNLDTLIDDYYNVYLLSQTDKDYSLKINNNKNEYNFTLTNKDITIIKNETNKNFINIIFNCLLVL